VLPRLVEELDDAQQHDEHEGDTEDGSAGGPVEEDDHERGEHNDRDAQDTAVLVHPRSHRTLLQAPLDSSVAQPPTARARVVRTPTAACDGPVRKAPSAKTSPITNRVRSASRGNWTRMSKVAAAAAGDATEPTSSPGR